MLFINDFLNSFDIKTLLPGSPQNIFIEIPVSRAVTWTQRLEILTAVNIEIRYIQSSHLDIEIRDINSKIEIKYIDQYTQRYIYRAVDIEIRDMNSIKHRDQIYRAVYIEIYIEQQTQRLEI